MAENEILRKLRMKGCQRALIITPPESYQSVLAEVPEGVELATTADGSFDFIHYFVVDKAEMERRVPELKAAMKPGSILWVSYAKGKAIPTDLNRDILRVSLEKFGLQSVAQVAIDDVWSAVRFKIT